MIKQIKYFMPLIIILALSVFLYKGLSLESTKLDSMLKDKPIPRLALPSLFDETKQLTADNFLGQVTLYNVWATWCPSCHQEHAYLMKIAYEDKVPIVGINYREPDRTKAISMLEKQGNPFVEVLYDGNGRFGIELGVYGAPETFVVDHQGVVRMRYAGIINDEIWQAKFLPLITHLNLNQFNLHEQSL
jgi:cytochrome c biogenesis protein CcmG/thiol:disulfide interchange protein DsbE